MTLQRSTYRLKRSNTRLSVTAKRLLGVIHGHATDLAIVENGIRILRDAVEGAVARAEIQNRSPVVGLVLGEDARSAIGDVSDIYRRVDESLKGVATDNLVHVCGGSVAGFNDRVEPLDC